MEPAGEVRLRRRRLKGRCKFLRDQKDGKEMAALQAEEKGAGQATCPHWLEIELQSELNVALALRAGYFSERCRVDVPPRTLERRCIGKVEGLGAEFEPLRLLHRELLSQCQVHALEARATHVANPRVAQSAISRLGEGRAVDPAVAESHHMRVVRRTHHIGARAARERTRGVVRLDGQREASVGGNNAGHLPAAKDAINYWVPS